MVIDKNCWHARLYAWWLLQKHGVSEPTQVNLCPYVRTVVFWAPLRFLFRQSVMRWISWPLLAGAAEYGLYRLFGVVALQVEAATLTMLAIGALLIAIGFGVYWLACETKNTQPVQNVRSFGRVLYARYDSVHKGICPVVHIR